MGIVKHVHESPAGSVGRVRPLPTHGMHPASRLSQPGLSVGRAYEVRIVIGPPRTLGFEGGIAW